LSELFIELTAAGTAPDFNRIPSYGSNLYYGAATTFSATKEIILSSPRKKQAK
jgi:hypothetical protein